MGALDEAKDNLAEGWDKATEVAEDAAEFVKEKSGDAADFLIGKAGEAKAFVKDKLDGDDEDEPTTPAV